MPPIPAAPPLFSDPPMPPVPAVPVDDELDVELELLMPPLVPPPLEPSHATNTKAKAAINPKTNLFRMPNTVHASPGNIQIRDE